MIAGAIVAAGAAPFVYGDMVNHMVVWSFGWVQGSRCWADEQIGNQPVDEDKKDFQHEQWHEDVAAGTVAEGKKEAFETGDVERNQVGQILEWREQQNDAEIDKGQQRGAQLRPARVARQCQPGHQCVGRDEKVHEDEQGAVDLQPPASPRRVETGKGAGTVQPERKVVKRGEQADQKQVGCDQREQHSL